MPQFINSRAASKAATKDRVLKAATAAFELVGYEHSTIRLIARAAGLSTGAVFSSFADKADLYLAVYGYLPISQEEARRLLAEVLELRQAVARSEAA